MILDPTLTAAYVVVAAAVAFAPGPDFMFVVASGMRHKVKGAVASAFGIGAGCLVHTFAAAIGVSAIVATSALAFDILRYCGALYLAYLGVLALRSWYRYSHETTSDPSVLETSVHAVFRRGLLTNLLNPKVIVFYLALLPQFVNVELGHVGVQMFLLGCIHNSIGVIFLLIVGSAAGKTSDWLAQTSFGRWLDGVAGLFFLGLALRLAISGRPEN
jgi:threonine/homoserine/homoserine lactone efflux protein